MTRHALQQVPAGGVAPLRLPIRRATAARLGLRNPRGDVRFGAALRHFENDMRVSLMAGWMYPPMLRRW